MYRAESGVADTTWVATASLAAILLLCAVGGLPYVAGVQFSGDMFASTALLAALLLAAIGDLVAARLLVLPRQFRAYRDPPAGAVRPDYAQFALASTLVGYAFPVAAAAFGAWAAAFAGQGLLVLPFAAIALVGHVVVGGYVRESLETLRRDISVGSGAKYP